MKASTFFTTIISVADIASAAKFIIGPPGWANSLGFNATELEDHPKLRARQAKGSASAQPIVLKNRNPNIPNAKTVKLRYGPFTIRGGGPNGGEGMIWNLPSPSVTKPCSDCMILGMNAGLEYPDGADANTDTKLWLHHMVLFNIGTDAWDATCTVFGLPHMIVASLPVSSERIFSSGNERTPFFFNSPWLNSTNLGYPVYPADRFGLITDLMNMNPDAKSVYITMYYDFVDGHPSHFQEVKPVWFDVAQCGISEVGGRTPNSKFDIAAFPWTANFDGEVILAGGHLHDGGTEVALDVDGKVICQSKPTYGNDQEIMIRARETIKGEISPLPPAGAAPANNPGNSATSADLGSSNAGAHSHMGGKHIMAMSVCSENTSGRQDLPISPMNIKALKKGQVWTLKAYYDYNQHAGMKRGNTQNMSTVMGIAIMFVKTAVKRKTSL